jgi:hypothetical protein
MNSALWLRTEPAGGWWTRACAAWGFALAAVLSGLIQRPAPPGQIPGAMTALQLNASGPFEVLAALLLLPLSCAFAGTYLARYLSRAPSWAATFACLALAIAPLLLVFGAGLFDLAILGMAGAGAAVLGGAFGPRRGEGAAASPDEALAPATSSGVMTHGAVKRRSARGPGAARWQFVEELQLSRADVVLIPTALAGYLAVLSLAPPGTRPVRCLLVDLFALSALRLAANGLSHLPRPGSVFAMAPLALLFELAISPSRIAAFAALLWIVLAPLATSWLARKTSTERLLAAMVAWVVYPVFVVAYPLAVVGVDSPTPLDFFEDGHELLPASEMLAGKLPYAEVVPTHGLLSDGGLELAVMKSGHTSLGDLLRVRRIVHCATFAAVYAIGWAATGVPEAGLLAALLSVFLVPGWPLGLRPGLALAALAAAVAASRLASWRWLAAAGALVPLAFLASPEFAFYSGVVAAAVAATMPRRGRAFIALAAGAATVGMAILIVFSACGFAGAFLRTTLVELPAAGPAYVPGPLVAPACLTTLTAPRLQVGPHCLEAILWILIVIATAAAIATRPAVRSPLNGIWYIGVWVAVAGLSYAERRHLYAGYALAAFLVSALLVLAQRRGRSVAVLPALVILWLANPLGHVFETLTPPRLNGSHTATGTVEVAGVQRARGGLIEPGLRGPIEIVRQFSAHRLQPGETWFDFTNNSTLYYLFDRRCPVRYQEIPFAETVPFQNEMIATLERDHSVRAALVAFPTSASAIDGVPNSARAPLVWHYLEEHFVPALAEGGVVFWIRR